MLVSSCADEETKAQESEVTCSGNETIITNDFSIRGQPLSARKVMSPFSHCLIVPTLDL